MTAAATANTTAAAAPAAISRDISTGSGATEASASSSKAAASTTPALRFFFPAGTVARAFGPSCSAGGGAGGGAASGLSLDGMGSVGSGGGTRSRSSSGGGSGARRISTMMIFDPIVAVRSQVGFGWWSFGRARPSTYATTSRPTHTCTQTAADATADTTAGSPPNPTGLFPTMPVARRFLYEATERSIAQARDGIMRGVQLLAQRGSLDRQRALDSL